MTHLFYLLLLLSSGLILASNPAQAAESKMKLKVATAGGSTTIYLFKYMNAWGKREVRLESSAIPVLQSINPTLGYGRDTDDDGKIDTWFMIDDAKGLVIQQTGNVDTWGLQALRSKVFKRYSSTVKAHLASAYSSVFSYLLMSVSHAWSSYNAFWTEWMDLEEFSIRINRAKAQGLITRPQWIEAVNLLKFGYQDTLKRFQAATGGRYWALAVGDAALWASGGILLKWLGKGISTLGTPITNLGFMQQTKASVNRMVGGIKTQLGNRLASLRGVKGAPLSAAASRVFKVKFPLNMRGLMAKNRLMKKVVPVVARTGIAFKKAALEWKYIAFMAGLQLTTESFASYDEVKHPNPVLMARNVMTNPEIMQNVGYMSTNAIMMTAATHGIRRKGARFASCGFIALGNSTFTNVVVKGEKNYQRIALDTSWESVVGAAQIQLDLKALSYFEAQSLKNKNPRLKLIGWSIVLVDQVAGFAGYAVASRALNGKPEQSNVQLVPVLVEK